MNKLGIFYSAFNEKKAVEFSIYSIKKNYPNIPIFLVSDGGEDFSYLSTIFPNIKFHFGTDTMSKTFKITDSNFKESYHQEAMKICIQTLFDRMSRCIEYCNSEYILMCDPDTVLRSKINIPENAKLLGTCQNSGHIITEEYKQIFYEMNLNPIEYWGATPTLFEVNSYKKACDKLNSCYNLLDRLCQSTYAMYAHDFLFPTLFALIGEKEQINPDIVECSRNPDWQNSKHPIIHQYKFLYPQK